MMRTACTGCCGFVGPNPSAALDKRTMGHFWVATFWPRPSADSSECRSWQVALSSHWRNHRWFALVFTFWKGVNGIRPGIAGSSLTTS